MVTQLALERLGGSSWYKMGWSEFIFGRVWLGPGGGRWEPGMERSCCAHSGSALWLCATESGFPMPGSSGWLGHL